ncbi:tolloid-like protein 2 [Dendronephthya gigantea]|uniref:tolloid-like protein 2 n=1 Tax=Dendronephthya gigantea TaxID=151771 RepID=UPI00106C1551|nr:tolloid-like protein 2 [Dendronephthya gigantea]
MMYSKNLSKQRSIVLLSLCFMLLCLRTKYTLACEKVKRLTSENGTLLSAENLGHFMGPTTCIWEIEVPKGFRIELRIRVFEIETSCCVCKEDYVEFYDGLKSTSRHIGRYCSNNKPINIYSSKNVLRVKYYSSTSNVRENLTTVNKFRADYHAVCGQYFQGTYGKIATSAYPNFSNVNRYLFTIEVPYGYVKLTFTNFTVGRSQVYSEMCFTDFIIVKEMALVELKNTRHGPERLCGQLKSPYVFSRGRELSLLCQSSSVLKFDFAAEFEAANKSITPCGGFLRNNVGYIYSYGYPFPYPKRAECTWKIEVQRGYIKLKYLEFNFTTGSGAGCMNGQVEVYDGWVSNAVKIRSDCRQIVKRISLTSRTNRLMIKAVSKELEPGTFLFSYRQVDQGVCLDEEFTCNSRECINQDAVCDGTQNCLNGSDELNCPKKKCSKALYALWVLIAFIASIVMVVWLWRTWRKAVYRSVHIQREPSEPCLEDDDYACQVPSQTGAPPTYNEALNHAPTSLPRYEEALLNDDDEEEVTLEQGDTARFLASSLSSNQRLLPTCESQRTQRPIMTIRQNHLGIV